MRAKILLLSVVLVALVGSLEALAGPAGPSANVSVFATGLDNPRGLKFGPDGNLYVAEGGRGGSGSTAGKCTQVVRAVGPYTGSRTGSRVSKISPSGVRSTAVNNLPSSQTSKLLGSLVSGVADVAFVGKTLYALLAGAGCSHGVAGIPNGVIRVERNGKWRMVADLGAFLKTHPVKNPRKADFEPDGTAYSMIAVSGTLYVIEPNHGELDRITLSGKVSRVVDISASQGHSVPTVVAFHRGNFYVGNLGTFPVGPGTQRILRITPGGRVDATFVTGLTAVLGVAFDREGRLYVLETSTVNGDPTPGTGMVVRENRSGGLETVASGLTFPTGMAFGLDGQLYVSNFGFGFPPGRGQIVRIKVDH